MVKKRVGIIGGGAAGLFSACLLKRFSNNKDDIEITILEKNPVPGKKLTLTGHGRCNITNRKNASELKKGYHEADNFLYPALKEFGPEDVISFFENELGLRVKEEDNNRIFPVCDSATKVRDTIISYISDCTKILCDFTVLDINKTSDFEVRTSKGNLSFDCIILACGGKSFPKTGSTGDSYKFAASFGHTVIPVSAALASVRADAVSAMLTGSLSGVSLTANTSVYCKDRKTASVCGEMMFADFGLTGPAIMELSREIPPDITDMSIWTELDLVPSMSDEQFDLELQKLIRNHPDSKITTLLSKFVPASVAYEICSATGVSELYAQNFSKENRKKTAKVIKHLKIGLDRAPSLETAYVTRGGVSLKEIDRKSYRSRLVSGLYIIGEAIDIDGVSGGYNLQACMSEAYMAVKDILGLS